MRKDRFYFVITTLPLWLSQAKFWKNTVWDERASVIEEGLSGRPYEGMKEENKTMEDDGKTGFGWISSSLVL